MKALFLKNSSARALAIQFGLPFDPLIDFRVEPSFYERISVKLMQRHPFVPIAEVQGSSASRGS